MARHVVSLKSSWYKPQGLSLSVAFPLLLSQQTLPAPPPQSCLVGWSTRVFLSSGIRAVAMGTWGLHIRRMDSVGTGGCMQSGEADVSGSLMGGDKEEVGRGRSGLWIPGLLYKHHKVG